jgi:hypothetical protein
MIPSSEFMSGMHHERLFLGHPEEGSQTRFGGRPYFDRRCFGITTLVGFCKATMAQLKVVFKTLPPNKYAFGNANPGFLHRVNLHSQLII